MAANGGSSQGTAASKFHGDPSSRKGQLFKRWSALDERFNNGWKGHFVELSNYSQPRKGKFLLSSKKSPRRSNKIIDNRALMGIRTLKAGMMSGLTSPARPWFRLKVSDRTLSDNDDVKLWVDECSSIMRGLLNKSNFYNSIADLFEELIIFGTGVQMRVPTRDGKLVFKTLTAGEYRLAENENGEINTMARVFMMTISQVVDKFVRDPNDPEMFYWDRLSKEAKDMYDNGNFEEEIPVYHIIQPRRKTKNSKELGQHNMPFENIYFEAAGDDNVLLHEGGYEVFPCYVPRWATISGEVYGGSPMQDCLGDCKQLQKQQKRKAQGIDRNSSPTLIGDARNKGSRTTSLPSDINWVLPSPTGRVSDSLSTLPINVDISGLTADMRDVVMRIDEALYKPLFAQFVFNDPHGDKMTAEEAAQRSSERLVLLTPTLQNLNSALLSPILKDIFVYAGERGLLPDMPQVLSDAVGEDALEIEYISLLAQAQDATYANAIEKAVAFVGGLAGINPQLMDNFELDKLVREYADIIGVDEKLLRRMVDVEYMREERAEAQQEQEAAEALLGGGAESISKAAANLHDIDSANSDAVADLSQGSGGL